MPASQQPEATHNGPPIISIPSTLTSLGVRYSETAYVI